MVSIPNSDVMRRVLIALLGISSRRTLDSLAMTVISTVIKSLQKKYDFLKFIEIRDATLVEGTEIVDVSTEMDAADPLAVGQAIDDLIRVVYLELKGDAGVYFINELKDYLEEEYVDEIINRGVDLDKIQQEQHYLFNLQERTAAVEEIEAETEKDKPIVDYSWADVSTWKYDNNVCQLFDSEGTLLDKLNLDIIVEDYVRRVHDFKETGEPVTSLITINEKEEELLHMLYERDIDIDSALGLLRISKQKLDAMVHKLLELEMLQYTKYNEVKLTDKGIQYLMDSKEGPGD